MSNYTEIVEGWGNYIFPNKKVEYIAKSRALICAECPLNVLGICSPLKKGKVVKDFTYKNKLRKEGDEYAGCGCPIATKTRSLTSKCPLGKFLEESID
jgi:hypothetical protein